MRALYAVWNSRHEPREERLMAKGIPRSDSVLVGVQPVGDVEIVEYDD